MTKTLVAVHFTSPTKAPVWVCTFAQRHPEPIVSHDLRKVCDAIRDAFKSIDAPTQQRLALHLGAVLEGNPRLIRGDTFTMRGPNELPWFTIHCVEEI